MDQKKKISLSVIIAIVLMLGVAVWVTYYRGKNEWRCVNGQWIKQGAPQNEQPNLPCGEETTVSNGNIIVDNPQPNQTVFLPFVVSGRARVFENQFNYRLKDITGKVLEQGAIYASSTEIGQFGNFSQEVGKQASSTAGILEVFDYSSKDGSETDKVSVPLVFDRSKQKIKIYFANSQQDPGHLDCQKVFAVEREIDQTEATARAAILELLKGPTTQEAAAGYSSAINSGVALQKLTIEAGVAKIDFNERLQEQVGGSCRVATIAAQITNTLKQFSAVKEVVISIDGRTEDILQP
jgi:hypothetical protein